MQYNLDLHTHLPRKASLKKYWKYVVDNKLLGTAITEYANKNPKISYQQLLKYKPKNKILIPGVKIKSDSGEVIVYSPTPEIYDFSIIYEENVSLNRLIDFCDKKNYLIVIAHPFGLISNSASYIVGLNKLEKLVKEKNVGVEAYTGTIGYLSYYLYDSFFLRKLRQLMNYLELNRMVNALGLSRFPEYLTKKLDQKSYDIVYRFGAAIELGNKAKYITAGSGSENIERIGSGIITLDVQKDVYEKENVNEIILNKIKLKEVVSVGPPGTFKEELFERSTNRITKLKAYDDLVYITHKVLQKPKREKKQTTKQEPKKEREKTKKE